MTVNYQLIGKRVKEFRIQGSMTQAELAERIDMSVTYISHIETAKKQASLESLVRIADVLGVTVDRLLSGNQANDSAVYLADLALLTEGCTSCEKRIIYEIASATKKVLLENKWQQNRDN